MQHAIAAGELSRIKNVGHLVSPKDVAAFAWFAVVDHQVNTRKRRGGVRACLVGEQLDRLDGGFRV